MKEIKSLGAFCTIYFSKYPFHAVCILKQMQSQLHHVLFNMSFKKVFSIIIYVEIVTKASIAFKLPITVFDG